MKIILLEEMPNLGMPGDVVDVKRGYAINYLLKENRAMRATKENLDQIEEIKVEQAKINAANKEAAETLAGVLNETILTIPAKAGESGKLFGSVTAIDIANALKNDHEINVDKKKISLKEPLRALGEHEVTIKPFHDVEATLKVNVVAE